MTCTQVTKEKRYRLLKVNYYKLSPNIKVKKLKVKILLLKGGKLCYP